MKSAWPSHKTACLRSTHPDLFLARAKAADSVLVPATNLPFFLDGKCVDTGLVHHHMSFQGGPDSAFGAGAEARPPKNEHGGAKFLVKVQKGGRFMIYDEKRTFTTQFGPSLTDPSEWNAEFEEAYQRLLAEIEACDRWAGLKAFFYCQRAGDQLQIDVSNLPSQEHKWRRRRPWAARSLSRFLTTAPSPAGAASEHIWSGPRKTGPRTNT